MPDLDVLANPDTYLTFSHADQLEELTERYFGELEKLNARVQVKWRFDAIASLLDTVPTAKLREKHRKQLTGS